MKILRAQENIFRKRSIPHLLAIKNVPRSHRTSLGSPDSLDSLESILRSLSFRFPGISFFNSVTVGFAVPYLCALPDIPFPEAAQRLGILDHYRIGPFGHCKFWRSAVDVSS